MPMITYAFIPTSTYQFGITRSPGWAGFPHGFNILEESFFGMGPEDTTNLTPSACRKVWNQRAASSPQSIPKTLSPHTLSNTIQFAVFVS